MTDHLDKPKRWRPRFSVRTLVVFITLVCVYFGCWKITEDWGIPLTMDQQNYYASAAFSPAPMIVALEGFASTGSGQLVMAQEYYLWFGPTNLKRPVETSRPLE